MQIQLERVSEYIWEIPKSFNPAMRVPARIFADEALLSKMKEDRTLLQAANVACLPGLYNYSIALPDAHEGYGFPIGGVAGEDAEEGVISPGGIGYDINCLPAGTKVLTEHGASIRIERLDKSHSVTCINNCKARRTKIILWLSREGESLYSIRLSSGLQVKATGDHPLLTRKGMIEAKNLRPGIEVATYPFEGVEYEEPSNKIVLSGEELDSETQNKLKYMKLIPLRSDNPSFPYLVKIVAYSIAGKSVYDEDCVRFYGSYDGLEELMQDVNSLGFNTSNISASSINCGESQSKEFCFSVKSKSFIYLLERLGSSISKAPEERLELPNWLYVQPKWVRRLFLASYFGAMLDAPSIEDDFNFKSPTIRLTVRSSLEDKARRFLEQIADLAEDFNVLSHAILSYEKLDKAIVELKFSEQHDSLINLWSKIGYAYSPVKQRMALAAVAWLRIFMQSSKKDKVSVLLQSNGSSIEFIDKSDNNENQIKYVDARGSFNQDAIRFEKWREEHTEGDIVWDTIEEIIKEPYSGYVYDIGVESESHNFIANGFVVSNCGVRLIRTNLTEKEVRPKLSELTEELFNLIPSGVGSEGRLHFTPDGLSVVAEGGATWAVHQGYGYDEDIQHAEEHGRLDWADFSKVSQTARKRGSDQLGTLGSGNHFVEIERVDKIFDEQAAKAMGIVQEGQILALVHTGSRGFGHQTCSDYLRIMESLMKRYDIKLPDRELACGPVKAKETEDYLGAMASAANFAWANRQVITHRIREAFRKVFQTDPEKMDMHLIYDVCHNIVKREEHYVDNVKRVVYVHRKGATRAFPAGSSYIPSDYRSIGQPVLIPGSMGTASWVLKGGEGSMKLTFGSAAHGAGRFMSRSAAKRKHAYNELVGGLNQRGIMIRASSRDTVLEESPDAYKDVDNVVEVTHKLNLATKVVRMTPIGVVKG